MLLIHDFAKRASMPASREDLSRVGRIWGCEEFLDHSVTVLLAVLEGTITEATAGSLIQRRLVEARSLLLRIELACLL